MAGGFVAIYRWRVAPEHERAFRDVWAEVTQAARAQGGYGSCLGRTPDGTFVAVAPWQDRQAREQAFAAIGEGPQWPPVERLEPIEIEVEQDLWVASPFTKSA
ncbi:MAG: antibiotic biosynthesis monooxygenase [Novosphingobium sp.]|nr:antibiotic biosynthesis monooxygenase [Novosphingobium sp.]